jgi:hypothetical protein
LSLQASDSARVRELRVRRAFGFCERRARARGEETGFFNLKFLDDFLAKRDIRKIKAAMNSELAELQQALLLQQRTIAIHELLETRLKHCYIFVILRQVLAQLS